MEGVQKVIFSFPRFLCAPAYCPNVCSQFHDLCIYIYIYLRVHDLLTSRSIFGAIINSQLPHGVTFKGSELCSNSNFSEFPWDVAKVVYPQWWVAPQTKTHSTMNWPKKSPLEVGWGFSRIFSFQKKKWPKIAWQCYALLGNDSRIQ